MSAYRTDEVPHHQQRCSLSPNSAGQGNRSTGRAVVQVVGKSRAVAATLVVTGVVLSGCASADGGDATPTTSSPVAETPGNPWDLPIEQRPALFDPCAEIPVAAIEEGVGASVAPAEYVHHHRPDELYACGWKNDEVLFGVIGTWRTREEFLADREFGPVDTQSVAQGRPGYRASDRTGESDENCYQMFFTSRGAVVVNVVLMKALREFRGERSAKACDVLDQSIAPVMEYIPGGDY